MQDKAQVDREVSKLKGELEAARAEAKQHAGKATAAEQASSQHDEQLARLRQEHEAEKQGLSGEVLAMGSRLAAAEAALAEAQQEAATLRNAAAKQDGDTQQGTERLAALQVRAETSCMQAVLLMFYLAGVWEASRAS